MARQWSGTVPRSGAPPRPTAAVARPGAVTPGPPSLGAPPVSPCAAEGAVPYGTSARRRLRAGRSASSRAVPAPPPTPPSHPCERPRMS